MRQTRVRFDGKREEDKPEESEETHSNPDKKRSVASWWKKPFSRQMSWDYDFYGTEYPTAVAAAAYAVHSLEEGDKDRAEELPDQIASQQRKGSAMFKGKPASEAAKKKGFVEERVSTSMPPVGEKMGEKRVLTGEFVGKKPSSDQPGIIGTLTEKMAEKVPTPLVNPPAFVDTVAAGKKKKKEIEARQSEKTSTFTAKMGHYSVADAWENEQMATIKDQYDKLINTIEKWEMKKKNHATHKKQRKEFQAETNETRMKVMQSYQNDIIRILEVADGARRQAEKNRRNKEKRVKEKGDQIRLTGKIPVTCLCF